MFAIKSLARRAALRAVVASALVLQGCETSPGKHIDYKSVSSAPPLEIPPDLTTPRFDDRYQVKSIALLSARAGRAFHEMTPISYTPAEPGRVYRTIHYGPHPDAFLLHMRSYPGGNSPDHQPEA